MTRRTGPVILCGLLLTTAAAAYGQPPGGESLAAVRRAGDAGGSAPLLGFVADAAGHVVAHVVADAAGVAGADFVVRVAENEYAALGVAYDAASGLGLLRITTDPPPPPYPFARDPAEPGRAVYGVAVDAAGAVVVRRGSVSRIEPAGSADPAVIRHNVLAGERRHGAPLFNNCGEAAGVIVERAAAPGAGLALPAEWVASTFGGAGLAPVRAEEPCLSEAEQAAVAEQARIEAERRAAEAEREREAAEAAHREAEEQAEQAREAAEAARAQTDEQAELAREAAEAAEAARAEAERRAEQAREAERAAEASRAEAVERAERERGEAEAARAEAERRAADEATAAQAAERAAADAEQGREDARRYVVWAAAAGGLLSVALAGLWLAGRRSRDRAVQHKRVAEAEAEAAREAVAAREAEERRIGQTPDVLLTGADPDGGQIALRVPGRAIARSSGAVVGRSPFEGEVVLNHPEVSRRHFRLFVENGSLRVADLGSLNGTRLDGIALAPEAGRSIGDGAQLRVGDIEFTVQLQASGEARQEAEG